MDVGDKVLMISLEFSMISHYVTVTQCVALCLLYPSRYCPLISKLEGSWCDFKGDKILF